MYCQQCFISQSISYAALLLLHYTHNYRVCLEQWIKAKYERMEFIPETDEVKRSYVSGTKIQNLLLRMIKKQTLFDCR